jgi:CheY-like chemotaxis protein
MFRILVVEDNPNHQLLLRETLTDEGYEVIATDSGVEAVSMARSERPDLVVLDLVIRERHGLEVLRDLLDLNPELPVVIYTGYPGYCQDFMSWAADEYVVKSSDPEPLLRAIERALKKGGRGVWTQDLVGEQSSAYENREAGVDHHPGFSVEGKVRVWDRALAPDGSEHNFAEPNTSSVFRNGSGLETMRF